MCVISAFDFHLIFSCGRITSPGMWFHKTRRWPLALCCAAATSMWLEQHCIMHGICASVLGVSALLLKRGSAGGTERVHFHDESLQLRSQACFCPLLVAPAVWKTDGGSCMFFLPRVPKVLLLQTVTSGKIVLYQVHGMMSLIAQWRFKGISSNAWKLLFCRLYY